ncbi:MAG: DUF177 domain-containing protein [Syntrophomonadaceae bacterium]|jgi:uncharacterized protein|nr:DUF177 domain-containing protein [Syntrophomonadaceae bacterium]
MIIDLNRLRNKLCEEISFSFQENNISGQELKQLTPVEVCLQAVCPVDDVIAVSGKTKVILELVCSRCLKTFAYSLEADVELTVADDFPQGRLPDQDMVLFGNGLIDIDPAIKAAIDLELPFIPLCKPDCKGLCSSCGVDRNDAVCDCNERNIDLRWEKLKELL